MGCSRMAVSLTATCVVGGPEVDTAAGEELAQPEAALGGRPAKADACARLLDLKRCPAPSNPPAWHLFGCERTSMMLHSDGCGSSRFWTAVFGQPLPVLPSAALPSGFGRRFNMERREGASRPTACPADEPVRGSAPSRRRDCHFADALSPSILKQLLMVEGGCSRMKVSPTAKAHPNAFL